MPRPKMPDHGKGQQKHRRRRRSQRNQRNINDAVQFLPVAAALAIGEMELVVPAHLRSQAGNIVAPSRKDFPYDRFNALAHKRLQPDGFEYFRLGRQQHRFVPQPPTPDESLLRGHSTNDRLGSLFAASPTKDTAPSAAIRYHDSIRSP